MIVFLVTTISGTNGGADISGSVRCSRWGRGDDDPEESEGESAGFIASRRRVLGQLIASRAGLWAWMDYVLSRIR